MHMKKRSKRAKANAVLVDSSKSYSLQEALALLKTTQAPKFDETVDVSIRLGIDPKKSDQSVRGTVTLPNGTGRSCTIVVIAKGEAANKAREAGADYAGFEDIIEKIKGGWLDFDVLITTPDCMIDVSKMGKVLGPKGLMPSPKAGTVTTQVAAAVQNHKLGAVEFRSTKTGDMYAFVGKRSFSNEKLAENFETLIQAIEKARPTAAKGTFIKGVYLGMTMSPAVKLNITSGA